MVFSAFILSISFFISVFPVVFLCGVILFYIRDCFHITHHPHTIQGIKTYFLDDATSEIESDLCAR